MDAGHDKANGFVKSATTSSSTLAGTWDRTRKQHDEQKDIRKTESCGVVLLGFVPFYFGSLALEPD